MTRLTQITSLLVALAFVAGCAKHVPLTPVAQEVQRRGYSLKESAVDEPTAWQKSTFRMRSRKVFSFRANQPMPNAGDTYCRFTLSEETYDSAADAEARLNRIHLADPTGPAEEQHYLSAMREGFRVGNVAYVFQTDAAIFWDEIKRLVKELSAEFKLSSEFKRPCPKTQIPLCNLCVLRASAVNRLFENTSVLVER